MQLARRTILGAGLLLVACGGASPEAPAGRAWRWTELTSAAPYPGAYNFPVHVATDGRFVALHPQGSWSSRDGRQWVKEMLPPSGTNSTYLPIVAHQGAAWAIGTIDGNYQRFTIDPVVRRTTDYRSWRVVGRPENLPRLIFSAAASFKGAIWLLGGYDGTAESNAVWRSVDGLVWERVAEHAPWSPRSGARAVVFRDRLWLLGGGIIDGALSGEAWSSADGRTWVRESAGVADPVPTGVHAPGLRWQALVGRGQPRWGFHQRDAGERGRAKLAGGARALEPARGRRGLGCGRADVRDRGQIFARGGRRAPVHLFERRLGDAARAMICKFLEMVGSWS